MNYLRGMIPKKKTTQYFHNQHIKSKRDSNFKIAMGPEDYQF